MARKIITALELDCLAMALLDNIKDTTENAWDDLKQAICLHEDTMSECAQDSHGRRLTNTEWKKVSALALRVGLASSDIRVKFVAFVQNGRNVSWSEVTTEDLIATVGNFKGHRDSSDKAINHYERARLELDRRCGQGTADSYTRHLRAVPR
jgi:hypothetical protein